MKNEYKEPEEIIDHNGNLDTVTGLMSIFFLLTIRKKLMKEQHGPIGQIGNFASLR